MSADKAKYIWMNGEIIPWENATTHVMSHVLHYGSGVFEGIKCYNTENGPAIFRLDDHIQRLLESADIYKMEVPYSFEELKQGCLDIVNKNGYSDCYIRPLVFYGYDTLGVPPKECPVQTVIACFYWGAYLGDEGVANGVRITVSPWQKNSSKALPSTAKASGHYMNSLLSATDAKRRGFDEALLLNSSGNIAEGSGQNIFLVKNGELFTNDEKSDILLGITRESIIQLAMEMGISVHIGNLTVDDLKNADEAFFTGTATEVTPIQSLDNHPISDGTPGKITLQFKSAYTEIIHGRNLEYLDWLEFLEKPEPVLNT